MVVTNNNQLGGDRGSHKQPETSTDKTEMTRCPTQIN